MWILKYVCLSVCYFITQNLSSQIDFNFFDTKNYNFLDIFRLLTYKKIKVLFKKNWGHFKVIKSNIQISFTSLLDYEWVIWIFFFLFLVNFGIVLVSSRDHSVIISKLVWDHFVVILMSFRGHFIVIIETFISHSEVILK